MQWIPEGHGNEAGLEVGEQIKGEDPAKNQCKETALVSGFFSAGVLHSVNGGQVQSSF